MKISTKRRLLSLLLAFIMVLGLAPSALLDEETDADQLTAFRLSGDSNKLYSNSDRSYELNLDVGSDRGERITTTMEPPGSAVVQGLRVQWTSSDTSVVSISEQDTLGHTVSLYGQSPGIATVTAKPGDGNDLYTSTISVTVSGIKLGENLAGGIEVMENDSKSFTLQDGQELFGSAALGTDLSGGKLSVSIVDGKSNIVASASGRTITIEGREAGNVTVTIRVTSGNNVYTAEIPVTVLSNEKIISYTEGCSPSKPLKFSILEQLIAAACLEQTGQELASITGLSVPTAQGTLYLGYNSPEDMGAGVGSSVTYYPRTAARGPYIQDITFVPNSSFAGEKAVITFTGQAAASSTGGSRTFKGRIEVTLTQEKTDLTVSTKRETPLQLTASLFSTSCQEQTGSPLSYVIFTLPPASQGALYQGYKSEWDYDAKISANQQYKQSSLSNITFVPAPGFVGTVTIGYAGYSVSGIKYNGQLIIQVQQGLDDRITYNDNGAGYVGFYQADFDDFCENATGAVLSTIAFTPPPASQGTLYYNWTGVRGTPVTSGTTYPATQIGWLTFVADNGFNGVVRIPFTGTARTGEVIAGTVEVHIQSSDSGWGDISYTCVPGQSVKLVLSDFSNLCQTLTGQKLHYISFQTLPDFNMGALYHNRTSAAGMGTRVTTAAKYYNSATPYIANLSFWATANFTGGVEIPFTGCAVSGETFTGILYISSGTGNGSGSSNAVRYTSGQEGVTFSGQDFDSACRQATNAALNYLRFDLPSSGQGILYYDYRSASNPTALSTSTNLYRTGEVSIDKVTFVPSKSFSGVVSVPFTGYAIDGKEFRGTVEVTVRSAAAMGGLVRYETGGAAVRFGSYDFQLAAGEQPVSIRFTGLPSESQGKLYYQYTCPTKYSWQGNTSTSYSLTGDPSVSNLTFIPKAGYYGTVEIPYTGTNQDGSTYSGTVRITVTEPQTSISFNDLAGYPARTKAAVDFLASLNVVNGTSPGIYEPGASIRRGDFCLMLSRAFQFDVGSSVQGFSDVPSDAYYADAVNEMYAIGVVNGVGGGRFQPTAAISRQDAALMVQRALKVAGIHVPDGNAAALVSYSDRSQVSDYAIGAVGGLAQQGLMPLTDGKLVPKADLTRGDMAVLLHRAMAQ